MSAHIGFTLKESDSLQNSLQLDVTGDKNPEGANRTGSWAEVLHTQLNGKCQDNPHW